MSIGKHKPAPPPPVEKDEIIYEPSAPLWMLTMGDTMSLLLTFFVMLMTFSTPDTGKLSDAIGSMKGAFGLIDLSSGDKGVMIPPKQGESDKGEVEGGAREEVQVDKEAVAAVNLKSLRVASRYNEVKERLLELGFERFITLKQLDKGIMVQIEFDRLFAPKTSKLEPSAATILQGFASLAASVGNEIQMTANFVEGDDPGRRHFGEWALARDRLGAIGDLFSKKFNIARNRVSYGYRIVPPDETPYLTLLLAEKIGASEVSMSDLISMKEGGE